MRSPNLTVVLLLPLRELQYLADHSFTVIRSLGIVQSSDIEVVDHLVPVFKLGVHVLGGAAKHRVHQASLLQTQQ